MEKQCQKPCTKEMTRCFMSFIKSIVFSKDQQPYDKLILLMPVRSILFIFIEGMIYFLGHVEGRKYCQEFPSTISDHRYSIAFLEPNPLNKSDHGTFVPADFVEVIDEGKSTVDLFARTCNLQRLVPRSSSALVSEICPLVSTDPSCLQTTNSSITMPMNVHINSTNIILSHLPTNVSNKTTTLMTNNKGLLAQPIHTPQQEIEAIRSKSGVVSVDVDKPNGAQSITFSILLLITAIFFSSN